MRESRSSFFEDKKFIKTKSNKIIDEFMIRDVLLSLINASRLALSNEIKYLFYLFKTFADSKNIDYSDIIKVFFFQLFLIRKCTIDNFFQVIRFYILYFNIFSILMLQTKKYSQIYMSI